MWSSSAAKSSASEANEVLPKLAEVDGMILFHLSGHGGDAPDQAMDQIVNAGLPTAVFSQPYSGHGWMYFPGGKRPARKWSSYRPAIGANSTAWRG